MQVQRRDFFKNRLSVDELRGVLGGAGVRPRDVISKRSKVYRERGAEIDGLNDEELLELMTQEPTLLRRPLIVAGGSAILGFDRKALATLTNDSDPTNE